ncbi:hypothetical protein Tco_0575926 [Tanacetum coccineum]
MGSKIALSLGQATVNEAVMNQTLNGVCRGIKSLLGETILPINNKGTILVISIVKGYVQNEPVNQTLWLAYTYSMPPILSLPLSMACDDSDGSMAKGENSMWMLSVECDHVVGEQRQGWSASWRGNLTMLQLRPWQSCTECQKADVTPIVDFVIPRLLLKAKIVNALKAHAQDDPVLVSDKISGLQKKWKKISLLKQQLQQVRIKTLHTGPAPGYPFEQPPTAYANRNQSSGVRGTRQINDREIEEEKKGMINKLQIEENKVESLKRDKAATEKLLLEITDKKDAELATNEAKPRADSRANDEARSDCYAGQENATGVSLQVLKELPQLLEKEQTMLGLVELL